MHGPKDPFVLAGKEYHSRLIVGTGKYKDFAETKRAIEASGADIVTVAVRRVNITDPNQENLLDYIDPKQYTIQTHPTCLLYTSPSPRDS